MAIPRKVERTVAGDLRDGERIVAGIRAQLRGFAWAFGLTIGIAIAVGSFFTDDIFTMALFGGVAGGISGLIGMWWARGRAPFDTLYSIHVLTDQRLLGYPVGAWGTAREAALDEPLSAVGSAEVGPKRWFFPRTLNLAVDGHEPMTMSVGFQDDVVAFARAAAGSSKD